MKWFLLAYVVISVLLWDPKLHSGGDNCVYMILAESIATGRGYRDLHITGEPIHKTYPPGFPLLLTPFMWVFGRNLLVFKLVVMFTGMGGLLFFDKITRRIMPPQYAVITTLLYLSMPAMYYYGHYVLSEMPYIFFSLGAIWFVVKNES